MLTSNSSTRKNNKNKKHTYVTYDIQETSNIRNQKESSSFVNRLMVGKNFFFTNFIPWNKLETLFRNISDFQVSHSSSFSISEWTNKWLVMRQWMRSGCWVSTHPFISSRISRENPPHLHCIEWKYAGKNEKNSRQE